MKKKESKKIKVGNQREKRDHKQERKKESKEVIFNTLKEVEIVVCDMYVFSRVSIWKKIDSIKIILYFHQKQDWSGTQQTKYPFYK